MRSRPLAKELRRRLARLNRRPPAAAVPEVVCSAAGSETVSGCQTWFPSGEAVKQLTLIRAGAATRPRDLLRGKSHAAAKVLIGDGTKCVRTQHQFKCLSGGG